MLLGAAILFAGSTVCSIVVAAAAAATTTAGSRKTTRASYLKTHTSIIQCSSLLGACSFLERNLGSECRFSLGTGTVLLVAMSVLREHWGNCRKMTAHSTLFSKMNRDRAIGTNPNRFQTASYRNGLKYIVPHPVQSHIHNNQQDPGLYALTYSGHL